MQKQQQKRACQKKFVVLAKFITKLQIILQKIIELSTQKLLLSSQKYEFGIREPRSGKNLFRIPDQGVKKAPAPGSGSATLRADNVNKN
jgi:hypothetical protein